MPTKKKTTKRQPRRGFMPRSLARKRYNNTSTRVMWFKTNGLEQSTMATDFALTYPVDQHTTAVDWNNAFSIYSEYKVLAIKVRWFPSDVGGESISFTGGAGGAQPGMIRGDNLVLSDPANSVAIPGAMPISDGINNGSAKMINSRRPFTRTMYRPKGFPIWGTHTAPDPWVGKIVKITNNASVTTASVPPLVYTFWYYTVQYKIVLRGRTYV